MALYYARLTLFECYSHTELEIVDEAVATFRGALGSAVPRWKLLITEKLSFVLATRFRRQGNEEDLSENITHISTALAHLQSDRPEWTRLQSRLSVVQLYRFELLSMSEDIDGAASATSQALSGTPAARGSSSSGSVSLPCAESCSTRPSVTWPT